VGKLTLKKAKTLDELPSADRDQVLASLEAVFNIAELIKNEYNPIGLANYIGIKTCFLTFPLSLLCFTLTYYLVLMPVLISYLTLPC